VCVCVVCVLCVCLCACLCVCVFLRSKLKIEKARKREGGVETYVHASNITRQTKTFKNWIGNPIFSQVKYSGTNSGLFSLPYFATVPIQSILNGLFKKIKRMQLRERQRRGKIFQQGKKRSLSSLSLSYFLLLLLLVFYVRYQSS